MVSTPTRIRQMHLVQPGYKETLENVSVTSSPARWDMVDRFLEECSRRHKRGVIRRKYTKKERLGRALVTCGDSAAVAVCEQGHLWARDIQCGREQCPTCGSYGSTMHARRVARWLPRIQQMKSIGYFVIEWPTADREKMIEPAQLRAARRAVHDALRRIGYRRGISRWHWWGDPKCWQCLKRLKPSAIKDGKFTCQKCGKIDTIAHAIRPDHPNPHLNIMVDGAFLPDYALAMVKDEIASRLTRAGISGKPIIHYEYRRKVGAMMRLTIYTCRASFHALWWAPEWAAALVGFHADGWWGLNRWNDPPAWQPAERDLGDLGDDVQLELGKCPSCQTPITWLGVRRVHELEDTGGRSGRLRPVRLLTGRQRLTG